MRNEYWNRENLEWIDSIDLDRTLYETRLFYVKMFVGWDKHMEMEMPLYGIYNKATGIREAEQRQCAAAKEWSDVLTKIALGEDPLGGMEDDDPMFIQDFTTDTVQ